MYGQECWSADYRPAFTQITTPIFLFPEHPQLRTFALAGPCASDALSGNHLPTRTPLTHHHIGEVFLGGRVALHPCMLPLLYPE